MIRNWNVGVLGLALCGNFAIASEQIKIEPTRGEPLYSTNYIECHNEQVHWRGNKRVKDWDSLTVEIQRWQTFQGLRWSAYDIEMVARYLNALHFQFPSKDK